MPPGPFLPPGTEAVTLEFERAFSDLTHTLQELLTTSAQQQRVNATYLEYLGLVQAAMAGHDVHQQGAQAYAKYITALQEALSPAPQQQRTFEAFDQYARAVREAWIGIDPRGLTPAVVVAIAQSLLIAASTIAGIAGPQAHLGANASPIHPSVTY
jgi:hypothetical protein